MMNIAAWIILGSIAGFLASRLLRRRESGFLPDIAFGACGALLGGVLFDQLNLRGIGEFNLRGIFASLSVVVVLLLLASLFRRSW
jgi:uncharacterized membrane protein YeaQ/YmgE (transglycosylase-associated protein family)